MTSFTRRTVVLWSAVSTNVTKSSSADEAATANAISESAIPTSYIRGTLSFMHLILYVLSLTKIGVSITDELVVFLSNDDLYKGSRLAFKHCLPARSKLSYHTTVWENICFTP